MAEHEDTIPADLSRVGCPLAAAKIVNGIHYVDANQAALPLIEAKIRQDPAIYTPQEVLDRCELIEDLGKTTQLIDELWTEVKAQ